MKLAIKHIIQLIGLIIIGGISIISCNPKQKEKPLIRVFNNYLYPSDIEGLVGSGLSSEDSLAIIDNYINQWIQQMVVLEKAKNNIENSFEKELKNYKNSLLTYEYERSIVSQMLDTNVTSQEIEEYYNSNKSNFLLKNNIIQVIYVKLPLESPAMNKLKKLMFNNKEIGDKQILEIQKLINIHAQEYYFDWQTWIPFYDFQRVVPVVTYNEELYIKNNRNIEISDDHNIYLARILDFKVVDDISPLAFEYQNIKNIILNKRKIEIIKKMQQDLLRNAELDNNIEYFFDNKELKPKKQTKSDSTITPKY